GVGDRAADPVHHVHEQQVRRPGVLHALLAGEPVLPQVIDLGHEFISCLDGGAATSCWCALPDDTRRVEEGDGCRVGLVADFGDMDVRALPAGRADVPVPADVPDHVSFAHACAGCGASVPVVHVRVADLADAVIVD